MFTLMELVQPQSLEEAYEILMKRKNNIVIGGSAFLRMGEKRIGTGIDLSNLNLNLIEETSDYIKIGAMTTLRDLEVSPILNKYFNGVIGNCVKDIIGVQFRNVVTVGGTIYSKFGFSDLIVALLALDTEVELVNSGRIKLYDFLNKEYEKDLLTKIYIKKNDVKEINKNNNTDKKNSSGIAVLNYHAFYDENNAEERANCTTEICHSKKQFKSQLNLIKEKDMLTLQMKEVEMYIDGKVQLPKSVLITIDDGPKTKIAVDLLTEYKMYATIFLVTSWFDEKEYYKTDYIELHSHTHNMHDGGKCPGGQGGAIKCLPEEEIQKDLKQSREELNGSTVFCYPFYEYNDYSIKMLKQAGFTMAFIGEGNNSDNLIHVGSDKFRLRRFVIVTYTTISDLNKYFDQIK